MVRRPLLAILLLSSALALALADSTHTNNRDALLCLKSHLHGPSRALATWNNTTSPDFCTWHGITCTTSNRRQPLVVALDMEAEGLAGEIPPCVSNLTSLVRIHMPDNRLSGHIPTELGRLSRLRYLNLSFNSLSGTIPFSFATLHSLSSLDLGSNGLSGEIPPFITFLSKLTYLSLTENNLTGVVPPSIANLPSLTSLLLAQNNLQGFIPDLGKLSGLQNLDLSYNNLSGTVPPSIYKLSSLNFLGLSNNNLGGTLPSDMGNTLPNIQILLMHNNHFEGDIPASLRNASDMTIIHLGNNSMTGVIPSFSSMPNLKYLMLYSNQLEAGDWAFFSSLANCTLLQQLNLGRNKLRGDLPANSIANLPKSLTALTLRSNNISGTIPLEIGNLSNLSMLYLDRNHLMGPIPSTLGQLHNLVVLSLSQNNFSGEIPPSIGSLHQLEEIYLQENQLSGSIPVSLASCQNLVALNLSCNSLGGSIHGDMLGRLNQLSWLLDLSHNQLTMSIPLEMGSLINLGSLNISHNNLTGTIPSTLGACVRLESLRVEGNLLQGSIPHSLASLKGIQELDLSHNNLSGTIPEFLETFTSLHYLNMSFNDLEGLVPTGGVFDNTSQIFLQGNPHLCANVALEELPRCFPLASTKQHKFIIPFLIALSALVALALILGLFSFLLKRRYTSSKRIGRSYMELKRISYESIIKATDSFSLANVVGTGQFGTVYKGRFDAEADTVAIKVFKLNQHGAFCSFIAECKALQHIRHRNLVKVITACSTYDRVGNDFKALVFEYMAHGSLENRLHNHQCGDWSLGAVICISVDIASALEYLHNQCGPPVVHCDLKPSNILFDDNDTAHVCDFGLARLIRGCSSGEDSDTTSIFGPRGSIGYIPPEYGMGSEISTAGDVYSYGIVLLEMLTQKRPTHEEFSDGITLHKYVDASLSQTQDILHPGLTSEMRDQHVDHIPNSQRYKTFMLKDICALQLLKLGLLCSAESPKDRPTMHDIYCEVTQVKETFFSMNT